MFREPKEIQEKDLICIVTSAFAMIYLEALKSTHQIS